MPGPQEYSPYFMNFNIKFKKHDLLKAENSDYLPAYLNFDTITGKCNFPMRKKESINYFNQTFTKDMRIDYKTGNPIVTSIFKQFDKNSNGKFDAIEWDAFKQYVAINNRKQEKIENSTDINVINHYKRKLYEITQQIEQIDKKFEKLNIKESFDALLKFEKEHPEIYRSGCKDKKDIPKDAKTFDASYLEMGVYDAKKDSFTGEICKYGYITGLEKLSATERKEYLDLLKTIQEKTKKTKQYEKETKVLLEKHDKYNALEDLAVSGDIKTIGSSEFENQMYERYTSIRSTSNQFIYEKIQETKSKINELYLKGTKTDEDFRQLEQYEIELNQLQEALMQWSIKYSNEKFEVNNNFKITGENTGLTQEGDALSDNASLNVTASNENVSFSGGLAVTNTFRSAKQKEQNMTYNLELGYNRDTLTIRTASSLTMTQSQDYLEDVIKTLAVSNFGQALSIQSGNFSLDANGTLTKENFEGNISSRYKLEQTTFTANGSSTFDRNKGKAHRNYGFNVNQNLENYSLAAGVSTDIQSVTSNLSGSGNFNGELGENTTYTITPSVSAQYTYRDNSTTNNISELGNFNQRTNDDSILRFTPFPDAQNSVKNNSVTGNISCDAKFNGKIGEKVTYNINPSLSSQYNTQTHSLTISPNFGAELNINNNNTKYSFKVLNQNAESFNSETKKTNINNTFTLNGGVEYEQWKGQLNYTNTYSTTDSGNNSNNFGASVGYQAEKFSATASYNLSAKPAESSNKPTIDHSFNVSVNVKLGQPLKKQPKSLDSQGN